jgi:hypothetical protein
MGRVAVGEEKRQFSRFHASKATAIEEEGKGTPLDTGCFAASAGM